MLILHKRPDRHSRYQKTLRYSPKIDRVVHSLRDLGIGNDRQLNPHQIDMGTTYKLYVAQYIIKDNRDVAKAVVRLMTGCG